MTHPHKLKGNRVERGVVELHNEYKRIRAQRVPLSGAVETHPGDIEIFIDGPINPGEKSKPTIELRGEVKSRKSGSGFKVLEGWLGTNDFLFLKRDRQPYLVVLTQEVYQKLMKLIDEQ
jgi:hypothetical protein